MDFSLCILAAGTGAEISLPYQMWWWKLKPCRETIQVLLEGGVNILATDNQGHTALDYALRLGGESIIELLMQDQAKLVGKTEDSLYSCKT